MNPRAQGKILLRAAREEQLCRAFLRLRAEENLSVTGAARMLGVSPSLFSGRGSLLARHVSGQGTAPERCQSKAAARSELSRRIEALAWFIPAASFVFWTRNGARRSLAQAVCAACNLPVLPNGWRAETRARFLTHIGMSEAPECPAWLRNEVRTRKAAGSPCVPGRVARQIMARPSFLQKYRFDLSAEELVRFPFAAVANRLARRNSQAPCIVTFDCGPANPGNAQEGAQGADSVAALSTAGGGAENAFYPRAAARERASSEGGKY